MNRYGKGRRAEWQVRDLLKYHGAVHVERTAGSHGACDLIADFQEWTWAVQVKTAKPSAAEIECVRKASTCSSRRWALVWWDRGVKQSWFFRDAKPWKVACPGLSVVE